MLKSSFLGSFRTFMHNVAIDTKPLFEEQSQLYVTYPFVVKLTETESVRRIHFAVEDRKMIFS